MNQNKIIVCWNNRIQSLNFAVEKLLKVLEKEYERIETGRLADVPVSKDLFYLKVDFLHRGNFDKKKANFNNDFINEDERFEISIRDNSIEIFGGDRIGAMYGVLDVAETIEFFGIDCVTNKKHKADIKNRGVKFNLPIEPYDAGDPFEKNFRLCLTKKFWKDYIEMLAQNRYNVLSLWTNNPFYYMFRLIKYPEACPFDDVELAAYMDLFKFIFGYAKELGIRTYIITWNIRITPLIARAIGLPEETGDQSSRYELVYDMFNGIDNKSEEFDMVRQNQQLIKDYFVECIKTLLLTYGDLHGIGTSYSEEMKGSAEDRQQWVEDVYLKGVKESGRHIPFIIRTNAGSAKVSETMYRKWPHEEKYVSWKYSVAHMYSHPQPQFEELSGAWNEIDREQTSALYTVRNDDIYTFRWGDCGYIRTYLKGIIDKPYAQGYYWGADGYVWAGDFQHTEGVHKTWKYDFERHWHEFELLGRLGYENDTPDKLWEKKYASRYGQYGIQIFHAMDSASKIIPSINRLIWYGFDFEWHPESLLSVWGFRTILDFMDSEAMPGSGTVSISDFVKNENKKSEKTNETPMDSMNTLKMSADHIKQFLHDIDNEKIFGETECVIWDLEAWMHLAEYYCCKIEAALKLCTYRLTEDKTLKTDAAELLREALSHWNNLTLVWSRHYIPYQLPRIKLTFGYGLYYSHVRKDIEIAENL